MVDIARRFCFLALSLSRQNTIFPPEIKDAHRAVRVERRRELPQVPADDDVRVEVDDGVHGGQPVREAEADVVVRGREIAAFGHF